MSLAFPFDSNCADPAASKIRQSVGPLLGDQARFDTARKLNCQDFKFRLPPHNWESLGGSCLHLPPSYCSLREKHLLTSHLAHLVPCSLGCLDIYKLIYPCLTVKMSIFGKLRRAKQAANEQKGKNVASAQSKPESVPYKHVPTHAATDALLGAPATWREQDKKAIQAQNQRRSQYHLSRNPSALSNVTTLNRDQSFTSTGFANVAAEKRKHYSMDWASTVSNGPRPSVAVPIARPTATHRSRHSQPPSPERDSYIPVDRRRGRFETPEAAPRFTRATEQSIVAPHQGLPGHSKDVKFYLPSSRGESYHKR